MVPNGQISMRPKLLPDPVDEQLNPSAPLANIHVELLPVHEQLADVAQGSPPCSFVND
jgi:hypothetical protein